MHHYPPGGLTYICNIGYSISWLPAAVGARSLKCWRNSLSGHPPPTGTTSCHVTVDSRRAIDNQLRGISLFGRLGRSGQIPF